MQKLSLYKSFNLILILSVSLGGLLYGYNIGAMSGVLLYAKNEMFLTHLQASLFVSSFLWGIVLVMIIMGCIAEFLGRKKTLILSNITAMVSIFILINAHNFTHLLIGRLLTGFACGMTTLTVPIYLAEIVPSSIRGRGTVAFQLFLTSGILIATLVSWCFIDSLDWRKIFIIELIPITLLLIISLKIPESPRWLVLKNKKEKAFKSLLLINNEENSRKILNEIIANNETNWHLTHIKAIFNKKYLIPISIAISLGSLNQLTGINAFLQYDSTILFMSGFNGHNAALIGSILITSINFFVTIIAICIVDYFERKKLLQIGLIGIIFFLLSLSLISHFMLNTHFRGILVTCFLLGFIISFAIAPGAMVWTLMAEILPSKIRSIGLSFALFVSSTMGASFSAIFLPLQQKIGFSGIFIFCTITTCLYLFVSCFIPKTNKRSLEEIEKGILIRKVK